MTGTELHQLIDYTVNFVNTPVGLAWALVLIILIAIPAGYFIARIARAIEDKGRRNDPWRNG